MFIVRRLCLMGLEVWKFPDSIFIQFLKLGNLRQQTIPQRLMEQGKMFRKYGSSLPGIFFF